jgi:hypothetical protein
MKVSGFTVFFLRDLNKDTCKLSKTGNFNPHNFQAIFALTARQSCHKDLIRKDKALRDIPPTPDTVFATASDAHVSGGMK